MNALHRSSKNSKNNSEDKYIQIKRRTLLLKTWENKNVFKLMDSWS